MFYGHMDQTLFIDEELNKAFQNPIWSGLFFEPFKGCELSKNKVQWLDLASQLWPVLKGCLLQTHFMPISQSSCSFQSHRLVFDIRFIFSSSSLKEVRMKIW